MPPTRREILGLTASLAAGSIMPSNAAVIGSTTEASIKPLSILILGGTGFTGPHQVRYALSRGTS